MKTIFSVSEMRGFLLSTIHRREYYKRGGLDLANSNANINYWLCAIGGLGGVW
jgi:hypothetical protein